MSWHPIDFQGIVSLDNPVIDLLHRHLEEQESKLCQAILNAMPHDPAAPALHYSATTQCKLSDAIEIFSKRCTQFAFSPPPSIQVNDWKQSVTQINRALWKYVEVLEGAVVELFKELEQLGLEQWHPRLPHVVGTIKELLSHKMDDLIWSIKRLDDQLWKYRYACEAGNTFKLLSVKISRLWSSLLDKNLVKNLNKSQAFLRMQHQRFLKRYGSYVSLQEKVEQTLEKFNEFPVIHTLDRDSQRQFKKLYQLLKFWEMNRTNKAVPPREIILAIRHGLSIEKATALFKEYHSGLKKLLFQFSRRFKENGLALLEDSPERTLIQKEIANCHAEIHMLGATITHYRDFLLRADPDPYVRSRLGFSEWIVGPEPAQTKPLLDLGYDVEHLNELCKRLSQALNKEPTQIPPLPSQIDPEIEQALHDMGQPLATHRMMRSKIEKILQYLQEIDEWSSFYPEVIPYVGTIFSKLLRADWKYNASFEFFQFQQLFALHQGLVISFEDRPHSARLNKFTMLLNQIQNWVSKHRTQSHFHDIELDMNDIKIYLQDFLAYVQRISQEKNLSAKRIQAIANEIEQQLLEYRYLFGSFFYQLRQNEAEGKLIRKQFLFVDQYFETIENYIHEMTLPKE